MEGLRCRRVNPPKHLIDPAYFEGLSLFTVLSKNYMRTTWKPQSVLKNISIHVVLTDSLVLRQFTLHKQNSFK